MKSPRINITIRFHCGHEGQAKLGIEDAAAIKMAAARKLCANCMFKQSQPVTSAETLKRLRQYGH